MARYKQSANELAKMLTFDTQFPADRLSKIFFFSSA